MRDPDVTEEYMEDYECPEGCTCPECVDEEDN